MGIYTRLTRWPVSLILQSTSYISQRGELAKSFPRSVNINGHLKTMLDLLSEFIFSGGLDDKWRRLIGQARARCKGKDAAAAAGLIA